VRHRVAAALTRIVAGCAAVLLQAPAVAADVQQPGEAGVGFVIEGRAEQGGLLRGAAPAGTVALTLDGEVLALAADGRFLLGFDRDHTGEAVLQARLGDGRLVRERIEVAARAWRIEHVNVAPRPAIPDADYQRVRAEELTRIRAARTRDTASEGWRQDLIWPASGRISAPFGSQRVYRGEPGSYHSGVDIAPGAGAAVVAPADGTVVLAGPPAFTLEGNLVILDHGMGLSSAFLHLASVAVREGDRLRQGDPVGTVGATGRATGPHLHWSLVWNGARLDPQPLAGRASRP
jgi:murein DD-endopeptidase MepM/ murein hydrolase activator NlpD